VFAGTWRGQPVAVKLLRQGGVLAARSRRPRGGGAPARSDAAQEHRIGFRGISNRAGALLPRDRAGAVWLAQVGAWTESVNEKRALPFAYLRRRLWPTHVDDRATATSSRPNLLVFSLSSSECRRQADRLESSARVAKGQPTRPASCRWRRTTGPASKARRSTWRRSCSTAARARTRPPTCTPQRRDHARLAAAAHEHAVALGWRARARTCRRADTLPTSCRASRADKAVAHSETACSCSMLDVEAKGGGEICAAPSRISNAGLGVSSRRCWCCARERSTIEDVVAQL
jgi:hypothetical protein